MVANEKKEIEFAKDYICSLTDDEKCLPLVDKLKARVERRNGRLRSRRPATELAAQVYYLDFPDAA